MTRKSKSYFNLSIDIFGHAWTKFPHKYVYHDPEAEEFCETMLYNPKFLGEEEG